MDDARLALMKMAYECAWELSPHSEFGNLPISQLANLPYDQRLEVRADADFGYEELRAYLLKEFDEILELMAEHNVEEAELFRQLSGGDDGTYYRAAIELFNTTGMNFSEVGRLRPKDFYGLIHAAIRARQGAPRDRVRDTVNGEIVLNLYDGLNEKGVVDFDDLYHCWEEIPTDCAIVDRLKALRGGLLEHGLTVSISTTERTAQVKKKVWKKKGRSKGG